MQRCNEIKIVFNDIKNVFNEIEIVFNDIENVFNDIENVFNDIENVFNDIDIVFNEIEIVFNKINASSTVTMFYKLSFVYLTRNRSASTIFSSTPMPGRDKSGHSAPSRGGANPSNSIDSILA
jgi:hypothetical protein